MGVLFSEVPDDFGSVFGELVYILTGIPEGTTADAEVFTTRSDVPVGVKRLLGGEQVPVDISCYMRRLLAPVPIAGGGAGFAVDEGRCVTAAVKCTDEMSPVRTFTGAVRELSEYEVLTTLPMRRTIAWEESDEISLLVPRCVMTWSWTACGREAYVYESPEYTAARGIVTLTVGMPALREELAAAGVSPDGVTGLKVTVRCGGESVAEVQYDLCRRPAGAVRLCWFNEMGALDYHTFGHAAAESVDASREVFRSRSGYAAASVSLEVRTTLWSGYLPRLWTEGLARIPASPLVWRAAEEAFVPVDVLPAVSWFGAGTLHSVELTVRDGAPRSAQNF